MSTSHVDLLCAARLALWLRLTLPRQGGVVNDAGDVVFEKEGERLCLINTKVMMMRDGKPIFSGTDEALKKADDAYIQKFLRGH